MADEKTVKIFHAYTRTGIRPNTLSNLPENRSLESKHTSSGRPEARTPGLATTLGDPYSLGDGEEEEATGDTATSIPRSAGHAQEETSPAEE